MKSLKTVHSRDLFLPFLIALGLLSTGRLLLYQGVLWDDSCWLQSFYASSNLNDFLNMGFVELRRIPQGIFYYYFFWLHKNISHAHIVWNSLTIAIQLFSAFFLYRFVFALYPEKKLLARLVAVCFVSVPLDTTLPMYVCFPYRLGLLASIVSFFLTVKALRNHNVQRTVLVLSLLTAATSYYTLMEGAFILEPARLFIIWHIFLRDSGADRKTALRKTLISWAPFFIAIIPLVVYKTVYKPYGIYEGTYASNPLFFLRWELHSRYLLAFLFGNWLTLTIKYLHCVSLQSIGIGIVTGIVCLPFSRHLITSGIHDTNADSGKTLGNTRKDSWRFIGTVVLLSVLFLLPPILLYEYADGRAPFFGGDSRHAIILQIGYPILVGSLIYSLVIHSTRRRMLVFILIGLLITSGIFFNNMTLDVFLRTWNEKMQFWDIFAKRFPNLPDKADFIFDYQDESPFHDYQTFAGYTYEYPLNMLYVQTEDPAQFRSYRVLTTDYFLHLDRQNKVRYPVIIDRKDHWGADVYDLGAINIVHYRKSGAQSELLLNREIIQRYPDYPLQLLADKDNPNIRISRTHPFRSKIGIPAHN